MADSPARRRPAGLARNLDGTPERVSTPSRVAPRGLPPGTTPPGGILFPRLRVFTEGLAAPAPTADHSPSAPRSEDEAPQARPHLSPPTDPAEARGRPSWSRGQWPKAEPSAEGRAATAERSEVGAGRDGGGRRRSGAGPATAPPSEARWGHEPGTPAERSEAPELGAAANTAALRQRPRRGRPSPPTPSDDRDYPGHPGRRTTNSVDREGKIRPPSADTGTLQSERPSCRRGEPTCRRRAGCGTSRRSRGRSRRRTRWGCRSRRTSRRRRPSPRRACAAS